MTIYSLVEKQRKFTITRSIFYPTGNQWFNLHFNNFATKRISSRTTQPVGKDVIHSTSPEDLLELALLTLCDHGVISSGTFSWWAAYLTGEEVVYFRDHLQPGGKAEF